MPTWASLFPFVLQIDLIFAHLVTSNCNQIQCLENFQSHFFIFSWFSGAWFSTNLNFLMRHMQEHCVLICVFVPIKFETFGDFSWTRLPSWNFFSLLIKLRVKFNTVWNSNVVQQKYNGLVAPKFGGYGYPYFIKDWVMLHHFTVWHNIFTKPGLLNSSELIQRVFCSDYIHFWGPML